MKVYKTAKRQTTVGSLSAKIISAEYKNQYELNQAIEKLITLKGESMDYSDEEKIFISKYTGSGGLAKKGASGKGLLYEYYTADPIVRKMWALCFKHGYTGGPVLEPAVGIGRFLKYAPSAEPVTAYETNYFSAKICAIIYPNAVVKNTSFETEFFNGRKQKRAREIKPKFTLVIGNPPYGDFGGKYAGMGEAKTTGAKEYDQYFILRGLDLLLAEGLLCMIVPSNFLKNGSSYNAVKKKIAGKAELVDAYRMPAGIFDTTEIGTDILLFRKKAA